MFLILNKFIQKKKLEFFFLNEFFSFIKKKFVGHLWHAGFAKRQKKEGKTKSPTKKPVGRVPIFFQ